MSMGSLLSTAAEVPSFTLSDGPDMQRWSFDIRTMDVTLEQWEQVGLLSVQLVTTRSPSHCISICALYPPPPPHFHATPLVLHAPHMLSPTTTTVLGFCALLRPGALLSHSTHPTPLIPLLSSHSTHPTSESPHPMESGPHCSSGARRSHPWPPTTGSHHPRPCRSLPLPST